MHVRVVLSGRNYDLAESIPERLALPEGCSLSDALQALKALLPEQKHLAESCLVAVSGTHLGTVSSHQQRVLHDGDELVVIAPVAGG